MTRILKHFHLSHHRGTLSGLLNISNRTLCCSLTATDDMWLTKPLGSSLLVHKYVLCTIKNSNNKYHVRLFLRKYTSAFIKISSIWQIRANLQNFLTCLHLCIIDQRIWFTNGAILSKCASSTLCASQIVLTPIPPRAAPGSEEKCVIKKDGALEN